eukprot:4284677-Prorocentrum_lima.AAC.1
MSQGWPEVFAAQHMYERCMGMLHEKLSYSGNLTWCTGCRFIPGTPVSEVRRKMRMRARYDDLGYEEYSLD